VSFSTPYERAIIDSYRFGVGSIFGKISKAKIGKITPTTFL
jgi:hypothetical protein